MSDSHARQRLVTLLDRRVFRPILDHDSSDFTGHDRELFENVKDATQRTREKYRKEYASAQKVYEMYRSDLSSEPAQKISRESRRLGLPALEDVEEDFTHLAEDLGVRG